MILLVKTHYVLRKRSLPFNKFLYSKSCVCLLYFGLFSQLYLIFLVTEVGVC